MKKSLFLLYLLALGLPLAGMSKLDWLREQREVQWKVFLNDWPNEQRTRERKKFLKSRTVTSKKKLPPAFFALQKKKPLFVIEKNTDMCEIVDYYKKNPEHLHLATCFDERFPDVSFTPLQLMILHKKFSAYKTLSDDTFLEGIPCSLHFVRALITTEAHDTILNNMVYKDLKTNHILLFLEFALEAKNTPYAEYLLGKINDDYTCIIKSLSTLKKIIIHKIGDEIILDYFKKNKDKINNILCEEEKYTIMDLSITYKNKHLINELFELGALPTNKKTIQLFLLFYVNFDDIKSIEKAKDLINLILKKNIIISTLGVIDDCHVKGLFDSAFTINYKTNKPYNSNLVVFIYHMLSKGMLPEEFLTPSRLKKIKVVYEERYGKLSKKIVFDKDFVKKNIYLNKTDE